MDLAFNYACDFATICHMDCSLKNTHNSSVHIHKVYFVSLERLWPIVTLHLCNKNHNYKYIFYANLITPLLVTKIFLCHKNDVLMQ